MICSEAWSHPDDEDIDSENCKPDRWYEEEDLSLRHQDDLR